MRGRVEGRGGDARADRRAGAGPDECANGSQRPLMRAHRAGDFGHARSGIARLLPRWTPGPAKVARHSRPTPVMFAGGRSTGTSCDRR